MTEKMVIMAAGISSRMRKSATDVQLDENLLKQADETSKGMIRLGKAQRPFLDYLLNNVKHAGFREIVMVIGEQADEIRNYYGAKDRHNDFHGLDISYAVQGIPEGRTRPWGTADAVFQALDQYREWEHTIFCLCNSDNLYSLHALRSIREYPGDGAWINYDRNGFDFEPARVSSLSVTKVDQDGYLLDFIEKPTTEDIERVRDASGIVGVNFNLFKFNYDLIYPYLRDCPINPIRHEKELPTAILNMVKSHPHSMKAIPLKEHVPDLTRKGDILSVQEYLNARFEDFIWN